MLQFGAGNFLRAFADHFIHQANSGGQAVGRIVVVQSTGDQRANQLNERKGRYHVVIRGMENGQPVDRVEECASISRALVAADQWSEVLAVARSPHLKFIISNTTEAGYTIAEGETPDQMPPASFPTKLLVVLRERWLAGLSGLTIIPCELLDSQADRVHELVIALGQRWQFPLAFVRWLDSDCHWLNTLVDRIVPGIPVDDPLAATDPLLLMAEPFAFWAIQEKPGAGLLLDHPAVIHVADVRPYFLRKVRILNGAHTALVCKLGTKRFPTVLDAMNNPETAEWLERLLFEEIVPVLEGRVDDPAGFARHTLERFRNPFLRHRLSDIALHHETKKHVRLIPTAREYQSKFGKPPPLLCQLFH